MIHTLPDTEKAKKLFAGWEKQESMILSCLEGVMGCIYVTDKAAPRAACACVGCFRFFAGAPEEELLHSPPTSGFSLFIPENKAWATRIEAALPGAQKCERYATRKDTPFEKAHLQALAAALPDGYVMRPIDGALYDACRATPQMEDLVSSFRNKEEYLRLGRGFVILKNGMIVSGSSSYTRYRAGIEIEVDTVEEERGKHLATAASANLILSCLKDGLYPSWDAQNKISLRLAEKLGYRFSHAYTAYAFTR